MEKEKSYRSLKYSVNDAEREHKRNYYQKNKVRIKAYQLSYYHQHKNDEVFIKKRKAHQKEYMKQYYLLHREEFIDRALIRYRQNKQLKQDEQN